MGNKNRFHLSASAAESYESQKVPAIFSPMAEKTLDAISLPKEATVLDVACGTGVVAKAVSSRLSEPSRIVGADINPAMIEIAQRTVPRNQHSFEWIVAPAEQISTQDNQFDLVFCQQGLQFFPDKKAALKESHRVIKTGGRLIVTCWATIPPFFQIVANVLEHHVGVDAAKIAVNPFIWNDAEQIQKLISDAGFNVSSPIPLPVTRNMSASFDAMKEEILATPNEPVLRSLTEKKLSVVVSEILDGVQKYKQGDELAMPQLAHLFSASKH
jgi:ubiquinone/menaquinone biosynthesis C-methylase UbiE